MSEAQKKIPVKILLLLITGVPIFIAGLIYLSYRNDTFLIRIITQRLIGSQTLESFNLLVVKLFDFSSSNISSLPSALWVFSTAVFSSRITFKNRAYWYLLLVSPLIFSISLEFFQLYHWTDGTFDKQDLVYSAGGWLSALLVAKLYDLLPRSIHLNGVFVAFFYGILVLANVY